MPNVARKHQTDLDLQAVKRLLETVKDPEVPVLSINELGILRGVELQQDKLLITITPTYSACPAIDVIHKDIQQLLQQAGYKNVVIKTSLSPPWTTDWISDEGRQKLQEFGIAPPCHNNEAGHILCPRCRAQASSLLSEYGSTACQSMYRCNTCQEIFSYFKAI